MLANTSGVLSSRGLSYEHANIRGNVPTQQAFQMFPMEDFEPNHARLSPKK
jgi:hypothetical protein